MITLHGRTVVPGYAEGEALVSPEPISGWGGIDPAAGRIIESRHVLNGQTFSGRILVFPSAKGSSGWAGFFQSTRLLGTAPLAMLVTRISTKSALGAVVTRVPALTDFDADPCLLISTGDWVRVDATHGLVTVRPESNPRCESATRAIDERGMPLRSNFEPGTTRWATRRAQWRALGLTDANLVKPKIAIVNSSSQLAICFSHLDEIARRAKRAIEQAGGVAFEVRTAAPSDFITSAGHRGGYILSARDLITNDIEVAVEGALLADDDVIRPPDRALGRRPTIVLIRGSLAPDGGLVKLAVADDRRLTFAGPAVVFDSPAQALDAVRAGQVSAGQVVVLRGQGPTGSPGMGMASQLVFALDGAGLTGQVAVVTDGQLSGLVNKGIVVGEVSPEAARGGPLALVRDGDPIRIDVPARTADLDVPPAELDRRRALLQAPSGGHPRPCPRAGLAVHLPASGPPAPGRRGPHPG